ncbi:hypothetical protein GUJ93_ZPchr0005g15798 [Zizania palustris]|uniref:Uncharacterized protein n=1 Tax=Zizania palustris TaxID=103762 RepID=A0A8J5SC15_ZIZPA|nr:hypothetical protein GUJ93_ZPchr0005g15798 [Zizania palustris]
MVEGSSRGNRGALEAVWAAATRMAAEMSADSSNYMLPAQGKGRKGRFNWTPEVHALFVKAVNMLEDRAAPKKIKLNAGA